MKIERHFVPVIPEVTLEQFAEKYDLTLVLYERPRLIRTRFRLPRFYCFFRNIDLYQDNGMLTTITGEGETEQEAINDYKKNLNLHTGGLLVLDAGRSPRQQITIPKII